MPLDLTTVLVGAGSAGLTALAAMAAPKFKRDETRIQAELSREQAIKTAEQTRTLALQASEDKFQQQVMDKLEKSEAKIDLLNGRINDQALEIAKLTGKVQILEHSESALKVEALRLKTELDQVRRERESLDFENQAQAQKISELNGRIAALTAQLAPYLAAAAIPPGGTTPC